MNSGKKSQRRIILSDDEDGGNDADRDDDMCDTPANKLAENMNTLSMNSVDKSNRKEKSVDNDKKASSIRNKIYKNNFVSSDEEAEFTNNEISQNRGNNKPSPVQIITIDDSSDHSGGAVDPMVARHIMQGSSSSEAEETNFPSIASSRTPEGKQKRQSAQIATEKLKSLYYNPAHPTSAEEDNNSAKQSDETVEEPDDTENNSMIPLSSRHRRSNASLTSISSSGSRYCSGRTPPPPPMSSTTRSFTPASPLAPRTRQSSRTKSMSSKQDRRRLSAEEEFQRLRSKGLDGVLDEPGSDDNASMNNSITDEGTEPSAAEEEEEVEVSGPPSAPKKGSRQSSSSKPHKDGEKALKYYNTVYTEQNRGSSRKATAGTATQSIVKKCIKYLDEENRGYREEVKKRKDNSEEEDAYSDIDDFIVDDEEVEEELRQEKQKKKKSASSKKQQKTKTKEVNDDEDENEEEESFGQVKSKKRSASSKLASSSEDDNDDMQMQEEDSEDNNPRKRSRNRKAQETDEEEEEEEEEDDDDEEALDGPLLYYKLNAMRDEEDDARWKANHRRRNEDDESDPEGIRDEEDDDYDYEGSSIFINARQSFPLPKAFKYYIEFLGKCILLPAFITEYQHIVAPDRSPHPKKHISSSSPSELIVIDKKRVPLYQSATRQIENLICTTRESLLGSSAWKQQFLSSLQSRPFYLARCRPSSGGGGRGKHHSHDFEGERCEACGRGAQCPDHVVYLFGPSYSSTQLWDMKQWFSAMPSGIFLSAQLPAKVSKVGISSTSQSSSTPPQSQGSSQQQNKQFKAFQRSQEKDGVMFSPTSTTVHPSSLFGKKKSTTSPPSTIINMEEDGVECGKRKRVIFISDDDDGEDKKLIAKNKKPTDGTAISTPTMPAKRQKFENSMDGDDENEESEEEDEEEEEVTLVRTASTGNKETDKQIQWWEKKLPRQIHREKEDSFHLAVHCKNRTQLYHSLLHYKFRLILKIREYLEKEDEYGRDLENIPRSALMKRYETMITDGKFINQEVARFQSLLNTSGKQYGGDKYELKDIWHEDHDSTITPVRRKATSSAGSGGNSGGTTLTFVSKPSSSNKPKTQSSLTQFFKMK